MAILTGGGGSGSGRATSAVAEGSGGSGAGTTIGVFSVNEGDILPFTIGLGGESTGSGNGNQGQNSTFMGMVAGGGLGGKPNGSYTGRPVPGGSASGGIINLPGGAGAGGVDAPSSSDSFGGCGGCSFWGGGGAGANYGNQGQNTLDDMHGKTPGAGGGGCCEFGYTSSNPNNQPNSGKGANGILVLIKLQ